MKCCRCGDSPESGKSFIPIDAAGAPNRRWCCTQCANLVERQQAKNALGKEGMEISRMIDSKFLK